MRIDVITIFPEIFETWSKISLVGQAREKKYLDWHVHDLKDFSHRRDGRIDDRPFGGGPGMVFKPEPVIEALESIEGWQDSCRVHLSPSGKPWQQKLIAEKTSQEHLILLCSRYEGVDHRVLEIGGFEEISLGDYVTMGGEAPAMVWVESVLRLLPGVLGDQGSLDSESFSQHCQEGLDYPHYTRPENFRDFCVPEILLSGDHQKIEQWRREQARERTLKLRPDLL